MNKSEREASVVLTNFYMARKIGNRGASFFISDNYQYVITSRQLSKKKKKRGKNQPCFCN